MNVYINDKSKFVSKKSIEKFKKAVKEEKEIEHSKYLNDGFKFLFDKVDKNRMDVNVVNEEEYNKVERRKQLRMKLKNAKYGRSTQPKQKLESLKRTVPENIFNAYMNIIKKYQLNIPAPDEVINNLEKHKLQISLLMNTKQKVSNDTIADKLVKKYFKLLGEFLGLEPLDVPTQPLNNNNKIIKPLDDEDTEDESDEAPELV
jgi:hypothetical protein